MGRELDNIDLTVAQRKEISALLKRYLPDTEVWAYGSRVKFTAKPSSDLDIVAFASKEQSLAVANLKEAFEENSLPFRVDFFIWDEVPEQFHKNIETERVVLQEKKEECDLPEGWAPIIFSDAVDLNPAVKLKKGDEYPFVDMASVDPSRREVSYSEFREFKSGGAKFLPRDTLMARITPCLENGKIARYMPSGRNGEAFGSTEFIVIRGKNGVTDNDFAYYLTMWPEFREFAISQMTGSSGRQRVPVDSLAGFNFNLPPLTEQRAIAHILGSLDDKIELNRRMNETLEAMAQALFKSWFVDFDPVIDNALAAGNEIPEELKERADIREALGDARKPLPEEIQNLFPAEFENTEEMGWIPKGWNTGKVCDLGEVICGKTPPTNDPENYGTEIPFITIPDMHGTVYITHTGKTLSRKGADTQKKKYLPINSICVSCIATPGLVVLNSEESQTNQQINSVIPNDMETAFFAYEVLSRLGEQIRNAGSGGSVFSNLSKGRFEELKILLGNNEVQIHFNGQVRPFFEKILSNQKSIDVLSHARDTILPQLLSGEIRIPEAEKLVKDLDRNGGGNGKS